jgi:MOB kinase activator 1
MFHGDDQDLTSNMKLAVDFFNHLNMLYGTVTEFCTPQEVRLITVHKDTRNNPNKYSARLCLQARGQLFVCRRTTRKLILICGYEYLWEDGVKYKRPTKLPAPEYVDALMNWAQNLLDDEAVFPNKIGWCQLQ